MVGSRTRARILKGPGVRRDRGEQAIGDRLGNGPFSDFEEAENQFAGRGLARRDPIQVRISSVTLVMVNVDEEFAVANTGTDGPETLKTRGVCGNNAIKLQASLRPLQNHVRVEEFIFLRHSILVPAND